MRLQKPQRRAKLRTTDKPPPHQPSLIRLVSFVQVGVLLQIQIELDPQSTFHIHNHNYRLTSDHLSTFLPAKLRSGCIRPPRSSPSQAQMLVFTSLHSIQVHALGAAPAWPAMTGPEVRSCLWVLMFGR